MHSKLIKANALRDKYELEKIDKAKPGFYKWWADK